METALDLVRDEPALVLRLSRGARLVVAVVDATGAPAPGVPVHVHDPGAPRPELRGLWAWTETDGRGRAVARLLPGRYRVDLPRGKHVLATAEVALEEEKESTVELRLPAR